MLQGAQQFIGVVEAVGQQNNQAAAAEALGDLGDDRPEAGFATGFVFHSSSRLSTWPMVAEAGRR